VLIGGYVSDVAAAIAAGALTISYASKPMTAAGVAGAGADDMHNSAALIGAAT